MPHIALATAIAATGHDDDMPLLLAACARAGLDAQTRGWDDATVGWGRFDLVLLRSTWDYALRHREFLDWCARVDRATVLRNPLPLVRWNTDKRYLADLAGDGVAVIPCTFVDPEAEPLAALHAFIGTLPSDAQFVIKPAIGAGARDARRYAPHQEVAAASHLAALLDAGRHVLLQPYLASVERAGETALVFIDGAFSHAVRKAAMLASEGGTPGEETITAWAAAEDERALAEHALAAALTRFDLTAPLPYARVDLIRDADGAPCLLELELTEPSLFLGHRAGAADRLAAALARHLRRP